MSTPVPRYVARVPDTTSHSYEVERNDYSNARQALFGRVFASGNDMVKIECDDPNVERALHEPLYDPTRRRSLSVADGQEFLALLSSKWDGTYVLATAVHDDHDCPFAAGDSVPVKAMELQEHRRAEPAARRASHLLETFAGQVGRRR